MSRLEEHTPLSPNKEKRHMTENERSCKQLPCNEDQRPEKHYQNQEAAVGVRTPVAKNGREESRACEFSHSRSDYGSVAPVTVCQSCQHLYTGTREVVLSPSLLEVDPPRPIPASPRNASVFRPSAARRYEGLCECGASISGGVCVCPGGANDGVFRSFISRNASCLRKVKVASLVLAAILPWVFLVIYIVLIHI